MYRARERERGREREREQQQQQLQQQQQQQQQQRKQLETQHRFMALDKRGEARILVVSGKGQLETLSPSCGLDCSYRNEVQEFRV